MAAAAARNTAQIGNARKVDDFIKLGRAELASERSTIDEIASLERLHTQRAMTHRLTIVGDEYLEETGRALVLLRRGDLLGALNAGQASDTLRAQWGALAARLGATKCGVRNDDVLLGAALDGIGG